MRKLLFALFAVLLLGAVSASAQRIDGDLRGDVRDPHGLAVSGAKVTITNENTGTKREIQTTESGSFFAAQLSPGQYIVEVEQPGFRKAVKRGIVVAANRLAEVTVALEVGVASETVTVEAGALTVDTQTATLANTYSGDLLRSPALAQGGGIDGNVINLAILAPGTTTQPGGVAGTGGAIGGNRPRNNSFTVDGLDNNNSSVTGESAPVISDAVKEFTLLTNHFSAEYGHSTAGQFIITTKNGTNELHGEAYYYGQNRHLNSLDNLNALQFQGKDAPRYDVARLGGQAGGPIIKDKLFYFGAYEFRNLGQAGTTANVVTVPTQAGLAQLQALASTAGSGISPTNVKLLADHVPAAASASGAPIPVCNEAITTTPPCSGAAVVLIPVGTFAGSTPQFLNTHLFLASGDFQYAQHKLSGRVHYSRQRSIDAGSLAVAEFNSPRVFDTRRATVSDVWDVNNRVVNEFRVGYLRIVGPNLLVGAIPPPAGTDIFGNYQISAQSLNIGPQSNFPQGSIANTYQFADNVTYVRGKHTLRVGADIRNILRGGGFLPRSRGDYNWGANSAGATLGTLSLSGLDSFVRDQFPRTVAIRGVGSGDFAQNRAAFYTFFDDSWKIHPRVTVELGLRYEYTQPARDNRLQDLNGIANVDSIRGETFTPQLLLALGRCPDLATCSTNPQVGQNIFNTLSPQHQQTLLKLVGGSLIFHNIRGDKKDVAPKVSIAWDVFGDGKTAVRVGGGRGFDVLFGNLALLQLPPQLQAENRESNACGLSPSPAWCARTVGGDPLNTNSDVRFNTTGFIAGGALLPVLPLTTQTDPLKARAATQAFVLDDKAPEAWTWLLSIQREVSFFGTWLLEGRYVGTRGLHLPLQRQLNTAIPIYFQGFQLPVFVKQSDVPASFAPGTRTLADFNAAISTGTTGPAADRILSPYGFQGAITQFTYDGTSIYHGASLKAEHNIGKGLFLSTNYTFSRTIDDNENELFTSFLNPRRLFNQTEPHSGRGLSGIHRAHKYTLTWLYEFPKVNVENALARGFLNGWSWSGTYIRETGQPVTVLAFRDVNGDKDSAGDFAFHNFNGTRNVGSDSQSVCWDGTTRSFGCNTASQIVGYVSLVDNAEWIVPGRAGAAQGGRGNHILGGINNWNLAISKRTPVWGERRSLEFTAELINAFNHPSFGIGTGGVFGLNRPAQTNTAYIIPSSGPTTFLNDRTFSGGLGQSPFQRIIQLSLRLLF